MNKSVPHGGKSETGSERLTGSACASWAMNYSKILQWCKNTFPEVLQMCLSSLWSRRPHESLGWIDETLLPPTTRRGQISDTVLEDWWRMRASSSNRDTSSLVYIPTGCECVTWQRRGPFLILLRCNEFGEETKHGRYIFSSLLRVRS